MSNANPEQISQQMRAVRGELREDVHGVVDRARTLADWRHYVRSHPWLFLAAGAAAGFLLVPSRRSAGAAPAGGLTARIAGTLAKNVAEAVVRGAVSGATGYLAALAVRPPANANGSPEDAQPDR
jgi:hypothetical protein